MPEETYPYSQVYIAQAKIYSLADKQGDVFYIGCTIMRTEQRLTQHISEAKANKKTSNQRKTDIIRKLNYEIVCTIIDITYVTAARKRSLKYMANGLEKEWIKKYSDLGYKLCNGRLPVVKKATANGPEFIGKTLTTYARPNDKDNSWIKIETTNEVKA